MLDQSDLARMVADAMDKAEREARDADFPLTDVEVEDALLVLEVKGVDEDGDEASTIFIKTLGQSSSAGVGMAMKAIRQLGG